MCGLQASLRAERADLCQGETLILKFSVVNTARKPASWVLIQNWDLSTPESGRSNSSAHARVVIRQKTGERPKRMRWASG